MDVIKMFMRFVIPMIDEDSHQPQGVFCASYALLEEGEVSKEEAEELRSILNWFEEHLPIPRKDGIEGRAIFWFYASAQDCIHRMWSLCNILKAHCYAVELQTCRKLGNIRYCDQYQVASFPSDRDDRIISKLI
jgi:hypothetical protein